MREILFRGKRVDNGEWAYGSLLKQAGEYISKDEVAPIECRICGMRGENDLIVSETVGQYTGLTDKNGTRIFEGDIIRDEDGDVMVVKWLTESAAFVLEPKPYASIYFYGTLSSRIEVIGNIHDDPELLEGRKVNKQNKQEVKADAGKPKLSMVPRRILYDIARVREYGTEKYGDPDNWKQVEKQRYIDAAFRHFLSYLDDPQGLDEESGLPHLSHLACNIAFLCELEQYG